ncbi:non-ribosomal peptide synthetase [Ketobacter sp.]|uniref:non-ribosomal peptide synthetase n=1 Tax=Ketobacter sp. TaxID=2083498 RepID=UPI000F1D760A|nr:non-ribosomal peptide synthetase [Ketobacter sp.]RLT97983.1 MAG: amino acid adenylation domain-containing protein [Ketobacter sp.]
MTDKKLLSRLASLTPEQREALLKQLKKKKDQGAEPRKDAITRFQRQGNDRVAMSYAQQRLWFIDQLQSGSSSYNISAALRLKGALDVEALRMSFDEIVQRHEVLRTTFVSEEGQGRQVINQHQRWELPTISLEPLSKEEQEEVIKARFKGDAHTSFDLINGPLLRTRLIRLSSVEHVIIVTMHHIISDGWSMGVFIQEMALLYDAFRQDKTSPLTDLSIQYADYSLWQREWLSGDRLERQLRYWKTRLDGVPVLELPTDYPRPPVHSYDGRNLQFSLSRELTAGLNELAKQQGVTLFMVLLSGLQVLLHRYSGQDDICVGTPIAGRVRPEVEKLIGCFVNTLAIRSDLENNPSFLALLKQVQQNLTGAYDHQDIPFERLVDELGVSREMSHTPLFQVMFVLQNATTGSHLSLPGLDIELLPEESETSKFDITINMREDKGQLKGDFEYRTDLFSQDTMQRMVGHFTRLLTQLVANPEQGIDTVDFLPAAERNQLLLGWNNTATAYERDSDVLDVFQTVLEESRARVAVSCGDDALSYAELDNMSNHIAHALLEKGVAAGDRVGLCAERSIETIAALLGILKAGAAYVPLDPAYPEDRLQYMISDSSVALILAHGHLTEKLPVTEAQLLLLDGFRQSREPVAKLELRVGPLAPIYVMYTSGSTGKPKGIEVIHRNVVRLVRNTDFMRMDPDLAFLQYAPISFDAATLEIWAPLLNGGKIVVAPKGQLTPDEIGTVIAEGGVNAAWFTAALFHYMAEYHIEVFRPLQQLLAGGDVLAPKMVRKVLEELPGITLINGYGPTENTTFTCCYPMAAMADVRHSVPIGRPIANTTAYVLDKQMQPVPIGVPGELYTGGDGVANGYLNRDELSADVFLDNPFATAKGARLYKTGDLVRYYADGHLEYLGRVDQQVKIRGFRIELSEVEDALGKINTIREVAVIAREDSPGVKRLVAYYVPVEGANPTTTELRSELKQILPEYMIPSAFVGLDGLPVTANGKLDRRALPKPEMDAESALKRVPPRTEKEMILVDIWKQVLNLEELGIRDNFFEVGGDSILSIQIISRAKLAGLHITTKQIFENQTIEELAAVASEVESPVLAEQGLVEGELRLSPIQHWFFDHKFVDEHHWNQSVLLDVKAERSLQYNDLRQALCALVLQHDALRLRFERTEQGVRQFLAPAAGLDTASSSGFDNLVRVEEIAIDPESGASVTAHCDRIQASLNLLSGPLLAAGLFTLPGGERKLLLVLHHLVVDGVSWRILLEDFNTALECVQARQEVKLGYKTTSYKQWAQALREGVELGHLNSEIDYWETVIEKEKPVLPLDYPGGSATVAETVVHSVKLSESFTQSLLRDVHQAYRTEINDLLLTALARAISDWSGNLEIYLDLEGHGRETFSDKIDLSRTVGWFTSVYPVRLKYENGQSVQDNLKSIKEQLRHIPGKGFGYGALRYLGSPKQNRLLLQAPQADLVFNYLGQFNSLIENNPWFTVAAEDRGHEHSLESIDPHPLSINSHIAGEQLQVDWIYSRSLFKPETIQKLAQQYISALEQLIQHCIQPGVFGYTPSDFALSGLNQGQIDRLIGSERGIESVYPLSPMQEGMLFHSLFDNDDGVYFEQLSVEVLGGVNRETLKQAWGNVVNRHPALRSAFVWQDIDRPLQIVYHQINMEIVELDWRHLGDAQVQERLDAWLEKDRQRGFDFERPGLMRLAWVDLPGNRSRLIWSFHHIVLDGWSLPLVMGEVFQTYGLMMKGEDPRLPQAGAYENFISYLETVDKGDALQFWKLYLADFEAATPLPNKRSYSLTSEKTFLENELLLDSGFTSRLQQFARDQHVTLNTVLQAAWGVLLARYSGDRDVVFGTTVSGRPADLPNVENIVGLFINTLPLRIQLDGSTTILPLLQSMQDQQVDLRRFEFTPLVDIHRVSGVPGDQSLFDSILVFENYPVGEAVHSADELIDFGHITTIEHTNFPMTVIVEPSDQLRVKLSYDASCFDSATIARVLDHLKTLLHGILSQPDVPLLRLPMLSEVERSQVLHEWNPAPANYPRNLCLHQIFERHVKAHPDRVALIEGATELSYQELNRQANQLARYLADLGVADGAYVGIALERSSRMIVSILATLKLGAAYVPLDPDYPAERVEYMLRDTQAPVVISITELSSKLSAIVANEEIRSNLLLLDQEEAQIAGKSGDNLMPNFATDPRRDAYVIYTSGSTGRPKGVLVRQISVIRLVLDSNFFTLDATDRVCHVSNVSFDAAIFDVWAPLLNGAAMVLFTKDQILNPDLFLEEMTRTGANTSFITTALFNMYMATEQRIISRFKYLLVGGEPLDPSVIRAAIRQCKPKHLMNGYGPTENTTFSTYKDITFLPEHATTVPVGRPISGSTGYVLDEFLQPVPIGVKGELYVGGDGVAVGYLNDPERTAKSFIPDPFASDAEAQLYRTGDIARYNDDGEIEILGRADDQVKVRGFRIELSEVEANLSRIDVVQDVVVLVKLDADNQKRLVAYVKLDGAGDAQSLRQMALEYLPKHMVPASFTVLQDFPLTSNGKVDKRALPEPVFEKQGESEYVAPRDEKERTLVNIWEQVLKADTVGIHDNFFELGGDSILSIQIISRAKRAGIHITAKQIFDYQTIAELSEVARELQDVVLAEQGLISGDIPLTPIQHWFVQNHHVRPQHFNQSLMLKVDKRVHMDQLKLCLESILYQHDMLRARFQQDGQRWRQHYHPVEEVSELLEACFDQVYLAGLPENLRGDQIEHVANKAQATLNLSEGPVVRFIYFDLGDSEPARLALIVHHLVVDVFSWRVLLEDLQTALGMVLRGAKIDLGSKTTSFKQWAEGLQSLAQSAELQAEYRYWAAAQNTPVATLPRLSADTNTPLNTVGSVQVVERSLAADLTDRLLKKTAKAYRTEINDLLLTALQRTLADWTGQAAVQVDLEGHGREFISEQFDISRTVGWFTSIYPVVLTVDANEGEAADIGRAIKAIKQRLREVPRKGLSYGLYRYLNPEPAMQSAVSEISFNYLGQLDQVVEEGGFISQAPEHCGEEISPLGVRQYLIEVSARVQNGQLAMAWRYSKHLHDQATMEQLAEGYLSHLNAIIEHCSQGQAFGYTPADFPLAQLTQAQVDTLSSVANIETILPLSPVQEGMLFHALYEPGSWVYFDQIIVPIQGQVDEAAMFDAWRTVVARHQILRTGFVWEGLNRPLQVVLEEVDIDIQRYDWSSLDVDAADAKFRRFLQDDRNLGFNFKRHGVMRLSWITLPNREYKLVWSFHHILLDGWSMPVVFGELFATYESLVAGQEAVLPAAPRYQDFIAWLVAQNADAAFDFWRNYLAGFTAPTPIPVKNAPAWVAEKLRTEESASRYREKEIAISGSLLKGLQDVAKRYRVTLNHIVQGVWGLLLHRYSGEHDVLFGTTVSGRPAELPGIEVMVGLFINTLPMRLEIKPGANFIDWLQEQQALQSEVKNYEYSSLVEVQKASALSSKQALFESILVFENYPIDEALEETQASLNIGEVEAFQQTNFPLTLIVIPGKELVLRFSYDSFQFEQDTIQRMLTHIEHMLLTIQGTPSIRLNEIPLLSMREEQQLVHTWNDTGSLFASESTLVQLFEQQVSRHPNAVAWEYGAQKITYEQLNQRANRLARQLMSQGVKPGQDVAISFHRSLSMLEAMLAVLKAGAAYVPIDPEYPRERIEHIVQDTATPVLITFRDNVDNLQQLSAGAADSVLAIEQLLETSASLSPENPNVPLPNGSRSRAYVIYTSGSTGKPKGVCVPQVAVSRLVLNTDYVDLKPGHRMGHASNVSFDAATFEFWGALLNGGTLVCVDRDTALNPEQFAEVIARDNIEVLFITTALFNALSKQKLDVFAGLEYCLFGGEACDPNQVKAVIESGAGPRHLLHVYGPTENTTFSTWHEVSQVLPGSTTIPIGRPLANSTLYVLDESLRPVPIGVNGEIYVGGLGLADGYLNRDDLTAAAFIEHPFRPGERLYKTGDLGRLLANGALEISGRMDDQVKIRGYRIELGEIETALNQLTDVKEASVVVRSMANGSRQLVAYCQRRTPGQEVSIAELKSRLKQTLPDYMVPSAIVMLDRLPLNPNGKVDKKALPEPAAEHFAANQFVAPRNDIEQSLVGIWQEVLELEQVGVFDDFFDLGGHSLLINKVATRLQQQLGVELPLRTLFEVPTVAALAEIIQSLSGTSADADEWDDEDYEEGSL